MLKGPALLVEKNDYFSLYAPRHTLVSTKNFIPFGPAVWPAIGYIYIYIIKGDFRIHVLYSRPNGWTEWADIF